MFEKILVTSNSLIAGLLLLIGATAVTAAQPEKAPTFDWPTPMEFQVEETVEVNGVRNVFRHTLSFTRQENDFVLAWVDAKCLETDGQKVKGEKMKEKVRGLEAMVSGRPPMRISPAGEYLGALMTPEVIAELVRRRQQAFPSMSVENKKFAEEMNSPSGMETFGRILGQHWNAWVGQWLKAPLEAHTSTTTQVPMFLGQEIFVFGEMMYNNHGKVRGGGGQVRITSDELTTGPKFATAMSHAMGGFDRVRPNVLLAERHVSYETVIDLSTLLPATASRKAVMTVEVEGHAPSRKVEEYGYRFFWPDSAKFRKSAK